MNRQAGVADLDTVASAAIDEAPRLHAYLLGDRAKEFSSFTTFASGTIIDDVVLHVLDTPVFPGEIVPINRGSEGVQHALQTIVRSDSSSMVGLLLAGMAVKYCRVPGGYALKLQGMHGCTLEVRSATSSTASDSTGVAIARQRFRLLRFDTRGTSGYAKIQIEDDTPESVPECVVRVAHHHPFIWNYYRTGRLCEKLWEEAKHCNVVTDAKAPSTNTTNTVSGVNHMVMRCHYNVETTATPEICSSDGSLPHTVQNDDTIRALDHFVPRKPWQTVAPDASAFSFWMARNLPLNNIGKQALLGEASTARRLRTCLQSIQASSFGACVVCRKRLLETSDLFTVSEHALMPVFVNPGGTSFRIMTARSMHLHNVSIEGSPSLDYTWYPGYAWTIISCSCGAHLGWRYDWMPDGAPMREPGGSRRARVIFDSASATMVALQRPSNPPPAEALHAPESDVDGRADWLLSRLDGNPLLAEFMAGLLSGNPTTQTTHLVPLQNLVPPPPAGCPSTFYGIHQEALKWLLDDSPLSEVEER